MLTPHSSSLFLPLPTHSQLQAPPPPPSPSNETTPDPSPGPVSPQDPPPIINPVSVSPTLTPTFAPSPKPTPKPTQKPPNYITITFDLFIQFPQPVPADLTVGTFKDNIQAQSTIKVRKRENMLEKKRRNM